ncbi:MAG: DedA family protein [Elusimicrobiota bacterium]
MDNISALFSELIKHVHLFIDQPDYLFLLLFFASLANTFFPPVPVEAATLAAGYMASIGHGSLLVVIISTTSGMFLGGMALYHLARVYGSSFLEKPPFNRLINRQSYDKASLWFQKYGVWALFLGKLVPGMNFCALVCSGILKLETKKAVFGILASNLFFFCAIALSGMLAGDRVRQIIERMRGFWSILSVLAVILTFAAVYLYLKRRQKTS